MRAILVSVDYSDLLSLTLPYNRHHFDEVCVVTSWEDKATERLCAQHGVKVYFTDAFWRDGARFNKWLALEEGLDEFGREGWLCLMDADVFWPRTIPPLNLQPGCLYTPLRRMMTDVTAEIPPEDEWAQFRLHPQKTLFCGHTQIFHADDPVLGKPPWHETNWTHAGGADNQFQSKWDEKNKIRPGFEVLHLGQYRCNWMGRATQYRDGSLPENGRVLLEDMQAMVRQRWGKQGPAKYSHEKLP